MILLFRSAHVDRLETMESLERHGMLPAINHICSSMFAYNYMSIPIYIQLHFLQLRLVWIVSFTATTWIYDDAPGWSALLSEPTNGGGTK